MNTSWWPSTSPGRRIVALRDLGPFVAEDGFANSPVLVGDVVVVANDQDPEGVSSLVALDQKTGQVRWKIDRQSKKASFSTPCLLKPPGGRAQVIVTSCAHGITSVDPTSGAKNWELAAFDVRTTGSPLIVADTIFATNGGGTAGKYLVAARPGVPERGVRPEILYRIKESMPYVPPRWPSGRWYSCGPIAAWSPVSTGPRAGCIGASAWAAITWPRRSA